MVDVKDENREKLEALLDEEVSGPLGDTIMNLVEDIVNDEKKDSYQQGYDDMYESEKPGPGLFGS